MQKLIQILCNALALVLFALVSACSTVPDATPQPVVCGWTDENTCPAGATFSYQNSKIEAGGQACYVFTAACVTGGEAISFDAIPAECKQDQFATCN